MKNKILIITLFIYSFGYTQNYTIEKTLKKDNNPKNYDYYGKGVTLNNNFYFVSASSDDALIKNGGRVYIYDKDKNLTQTLPESFTPTKGAHFGYNITANDNYLVIGADKQIGSTGNKSGKAYIYKFNKNECKWILDKTLEGDSKLKNDAFGSSVSIDENNSILITSESYSSYPDPNSSDPHGGDSNEGKGYLYQKQGADWVRTSDLTYYEHNFNIPVAGDGFKQRMGQESSSIDGDFIAIGARYYSRVEGHGTKKIGAVNVFKKNNNGIWEKFQRITSTDVKSSCTSHTFGCEVGKAVSIEDDVLVFSGTSINVNNIKKAGKVFVYRKSGDKFVEEAVITEPSNNLKEKAYFGNKVIIKNGLIYVSSFSNQGKVYVYQKKSNGWELKQTLNTPNSESKFGRSLAVLGNTIMIGSDNTDGKGRAYLFTDENNTTDNSSIIANGEQRILTEIGQWHDKYNSILTNDKLSDGTKAKSTNYQFIEKSNPLIVTNESTGLLKLNGYVPSTSDFSQYITYKIRENGICLSSKDVFSGKVKTQIKIKNSIKANNDTFEAIDSGETTTKSVFDNDKLSGKNKGMVAHVTFELINNPPNGFSITPEGKIVTNNVLPGNYTLNYKICEKNLSGFTNCSTAKSTISVKNTLSIEDIKLNNTSIKIFPNPSDQFIKLSDLNKKEKYSLYNTLGMELDNGTISNNEKIDISNLNKGIYFLRFKNGSIFKFIKE